jgi:glutaredoxin
MDMIVLYTTNCPRCKVLETKLKEKNIDFEINENVNDLIDLGLMSAPALSINGNILQFKEAVDWVNAQEELNEN